ncbi:hypothetical protein [Massilia sp. DWR3-1-1]|uniref:hypothetical protein n=1 Tax=Massilia sp. DWR3-1-1 TaxID=2804559 RepID=UPI003CF4A8EE
MTIDKINKKSAREIIADAMKILQGKSYVMQPKKVISFGNYSDLSRGQIDQGVVAFVVHCNLSGGSAGFMDRRSQVSSATPGY